DRAGQPIPGRHGPGLLPAMRDACNRAQLDAAVGINSVERFLGDEAFRKGWQVPVDAAPTGKRVLVVEAGPSGLSAAYHLTRLGHGAAAAPRRVTASQAATGTAPAPTTRSASPGRGGTVREPLRTRLWTLLGFA